MLISFMHLQVFSAYPLYFFDSLWLSHCLQYWICWIGQRSITWWWSLFTILACDMFMVSYYRAVCHMRCHWNHFYKKERGVKVGNHITALIISLDVIYIICCFSPFMLLTFIHNPLVTSLTYCAKLMCYLLPFSYGHLFCLLKIYFH